MCVCTFIPCFVYTQACLEVVSDMEVSVKHDPSGTTSYTELTLSQDLLFLTGFGFLYNSLLPLDFSVLEAISQACGILFWQSWTYTEYLPWQKVKKPTGQQTRGSAKELVGWRKSYDFIAGAVICMHKLRQWALPVTFWVFVRVQSIDNRLNNSTCSLPCGW